MNRFLVLFAISAFLFAGIHCKKNNASPNNNNNNNNGNNVTPFSTAAGTPTGPIISKFIPSGGGSIATADGRIELVFPNGALPDGDTITIQNITNNGPGGLGDAYRFLPEGVKFANPVTMNFHYNDSDVNGTLPQFIHMAYQDSTGVWNDAGNGSVDTSSKILSTTISHFSGWNPYTDLKILLNEGDEKGGWLQVNKNQTYSIWYVPKDPSGRIGQTQGIPATLVKNWSVNKVVNGNTTYGKIALVSGASPTSAAKCKYTAPAKPPTSKNPVAIGAELNTLADYNNPVLATYASITLFHYVRIYDVALKFHVDLNFAVPSFNQSGSYFAWNDRGSFDVLVSGTSGTVTNISNSNATITLDSNTSTCITTLAQPAVGPIDIRYGNTVNSDVFFVSSQNLVVVGFDVNQNYYIRDAVWNYQCPGSQPTQSGGGLGPPFPETLQFALVTYVQTFAIGQYTITVKPIQ